MKTNETTKEKTPAKNTPKEKYVIFPITITKWNNDEIESFTISKSYKDKEGEWQNTTSFSEGDMAIIAKILSKI